METDMELLYTGNNFSSKEISFIKSESDAIYQSDCAPEQYISDFLVQKQDQPLDVNDSDNQWLKHFNMFIQSVLQKLEQVNSAQQEQQEATTYNRFTSAVIRFGCLSGISIEKSPLNCNEKNKKKKERDSNGTDKTDKIVSNGSDLRERLIDALNASIADTCGIWQWLSESTLVITVFGDPLKAENTIRDFINFIDTTLNIPYHTGAAVFPFIDFAPSMIPCNAVKALDHAAFLPPGGITFFDDVTQNIYADRLYQLGRVEDAAREYEKGLEIKNDNLNLLNSLGVCYSLMNRLDLAKKLFEKAIAYQRLTQYEHSDHNQFMFFYNAALTCNLMDDIQNGINYIKQATAINKNFFEAELTAGILLLKAGMINETLAKDGELINEALIHIQNAVRLNPQSGMAHRILGEFYLKTSLPAKAAHAYTRAIKLNPCDASAISGLARAFEIQNKNLDIALDLAIHSLSIVPDNHSFRARLANIYLKKGQYEFADIEFSKAEKQFKESESYLKKDKHDEKKTPLFLDAPDVIEDSTIVTEGLEIDTLFDYEDAKTDTLKKRSA